MNPIWAARRHRFPSVDLPKTAEIVVVGGGLTGLLTAIRLAESGRTTTVVEAETVGAGASGRNGGLLLPGTAEPYPALIRRWGRQRASDMWAAAESGASELLSLTEEHGIDAWFRPEGALHAATSEAEAAELSGATIDLVQDGFQAAWVEAPDLETWLHPTALTGNGSTTLHGALFQPHGGPLHSGLLVSGLALAATRLGASICLETPVTEVGETPDGAFVDTRRGRVWTDAVVVATNAANATSRELDENDADGVDEDRDRPGFGRPSADAPPDKRELGQRAPGQPAPGQREPGQRAPGPPEPGPPEPGQAPEPLLPELGPLLTPVRGQVLSSVPVRGVIQGAWSLNRGFEYMQQLPDGRIVLGGMRWAVPDREVGVWDLEPRTEIQSGLAEWLHRLAPDHDRPPVESQWAGIMAWTPDRLPLVGRVPERERLWVSLGYSGHGVPLAPVAARVLRAGINQERERPPAADWFDPSRPLV